MRRVVLAVVIVCSTVAQADLSAQSGAQVTGAVFSTHPGGWDREIVWLEAKLRDPGACRLSAAIGDERLEVEPTATGFSSTMMPPPPEGARLKVGCGTQLRDTGIVFQRSRLQE